MRCLSVAAPDWPDENTCKLINGNDQFLIHIHDKLLNFPEINVRGCAKACCSYKDECIFLLKEDGKRLGEKSTLFQPKV